jgi:3-oxoacyl-[acyl-carrier-protein] synthase-3
MSQLNAVITGINTFVPEYILTNEELSTMVDTNDEWIQSRTGIKERHILKGEGQGTSVMAIKAVQGLLEKTSTKAEDIDLIICATVTPDMLFPATSNIIAHGTGCVNAFAFDTNAACSGFLFAVQTGRMYVQSGLYKKVIVVGADKMSSITDYTDRKNCVLFGDAAGAILLEPTTEDLGIMDADLHTDGSGKDYLYQKAGGSAYPPTQETVANREHFIYQEGQSVFKFAVSRMADVSADMMTKHQIKPEELAWLVPHQANLRIIDATARRMGINKDQVMVNIAKYGNTTDATIPLCLDDWESQLKKGDKIILSAFGGGFTWGAIYLKWGYDGDKMKQIK